MTRVWAAVPAAGAGRRFGGDVPKQYLDVAGRPLIAHALDALTADARVEGIAVAIAGDDARWPGWTSWRGRPLLACAGGDERAASVLAALERIRTAAGDDVLVLVHDAARPNLARADLARLIDAALDTPDGALLGAPVRDTLKRVDAEGRSAGTQPREGLWRALTPQAARLPVLHDALARAAADGVAVTDDAMALERIGLRPRLVEGREDNIKVTTPADLALATFLLERPVLPETR